MDWNIVACSYAKRRMTDTWHWLWCGAPAKPTLEQSLRKPTDTSPVETKRATQTQSTAKDLNCADI